MLHPTHHFLTTIKCNLLKHKQLFGRSQDKLPHHHLTELGQRENLLITTIKSSRRRPCKSAKLVL
ncbi:unnamed protein product, partial [Vitis vinifera]|uniref:Uncharacterized protein n=1 Tax=Vitis vinifera TaxID=29760 RepID=E0CP08_VITVI